MKRFVLDTSIIVKWFSQEKESEKAKTLLEKLEKKEIEIFLPVLTKYELANALLKGKKLSYLQAKKALEAFYALPLIFVNEDFKLAQKSYQLAQKLKITYYDACFLALTKMQKATLITANPKHQKIGESIKIIPLADF